MHCLQDPIAKNFVANEHHSFTFVFTFSVVVVDLPIDCILSFLFPAETDVLVPVFSQSTYVVVVNFLVVLKFPIILAERVLILSLAARSVHARIGSGVQFRLGHSVWYSQLPSNKP